MSILYNRELSWLSFNYRVLQEAKDPSVPLYERIKFLAIYSSNLDEFFRVRVASLRSLMVLKKKKLKFDPAELLKDIYSVVNKQQNEFGEIFREQIIPDLNNNGIYLIKDDEADSEQRKYIKSFFASEVLPHLNTTLITGKGVSLFLRNNVLYLAVRMYSASGKNGNEEQKTKTSRYALVEIPTDKLSRFVQLANQGNKHFIMFLDDVIRLNLSVLFPGYKVAEAYSIKLTRDAELYIDDEFSGNLLEKIKTSLSKRKTGVPCRFLYDEKMPRDFLKYLRTALTLTKEDLIPGGRYHNFYDFFGFPNPAGESLFYPPMPPLENKDLNSGDIFSTVAQRDVCLVYPFQSFRYVIDFLSQAAADPNVFSIKITLYRTAKDSKIIKALIDAARNGKSVTAFVEVKARFDEELNFRNADDLEKAGVKVHYSFPGLKVHSKMCLIGRKEESVNKYYAYLSTGNFNEKTASVYSDIALFTSQESITSELRKLFNFLCRKSTSEEFDTLGAAPFNLRKKLSRLIKNEAANASEGKKALIILKLNSLEDKKMIKKLYAAAEQGVKIKINVRGICCIKPDKKGNITIRSIVDRYLEHARIYYFYNEGDEKLFISSADFMKRNFDHRVELLIPVLDKLLFKRIKELLGSYFRDNVKARKINITQNNPYLKSRGKEYRSQYEIYRYLKKVTEETNAVPAEIHKV